MNLRILGNLEFVLVLLQKLPTRFDFDIQKCTFLGSDYDLDRHPLPEFLEMISAGYEKFFPLQHLEITREFRPLQKQMVKSKNQNSASRQVPVGRLPVLYLSSIQAPH